VQLPTDLLEKCVASCTFAGRGLFLAELFVQPGQKTRQVVHLLRAVHEQIAGGGLQPGDNVGVSDGVDELDIALLDALHVNPQLSFEELGRVLDVSPVTAARRWRRLVSTGRAWVSSAIGPRLPVRAALLEAECEPGAANSVADEFATRPQVFSVNITTGRDNIYAFVVAAAQPLLSELIVDVLPAVPGLRRVQSALMTQLFSGTRWRLGGLSSGQVRAVTPDPATNVQAHEFDEFDRELFLALQRDGRLSHRDLAAAVGQSEPVPNRFRPCGSGLADRRRAQAWGQGCIGGRGGTCACSISRDAVLRCDRGCRHGKHFRHNAAT
jgi:DNA-binding Lrp family transcriptional regulator